MVLPSPLGERKGPIAQRWEGEGASDEPEGRAAMTQFLQILIGGLVQGSVFAVIALGLSLVSRVTGIINLAQGGFCAFSALLLYSLEASFGWPVPLAVLGAVAGTTIAGLALGATTFVPALRYLPNSSMLMLTAGLLTVLEGVTLARSRSSVSRCRRKRSGSAALARSSLPRRGMCWRAPRSAARSPPARRIRSPRGSSASR
jgi:branched-subunit amino acid ABC-type transport system permease component